jgi:hypothetical protein
MVGNVLLIEILTKSMDELSSAATKCMVCKSADNPHWEEAMDLLDDCAYDIRALVDSMLVQTRET